MLASFRLSRQWLAGVFLAGLIVNIVPAQTGGKTEMKSSSPMVPGFVRFYHDAKADAAKGGHLLLSELNCISCHAPEKSLESAFLPRSAPILDNVGSRVKRSYLKAFLSDPQAIKPGTTMPNVFAGLDEKEKLEKAEALAQFLAATGTPAQARPDRKGIASGRDLYHKVGCVTCHGTRDAKGDQEKLFASSIALGSLKTKYTLASLKAFLENPHQVRPSGRMPGLLLTGKEAGDVANYLMQGTTADSTTNMTYSYYEGVWTKLPNFGKLKPVATGEAADFELSVARRINDVALKFEGYVKIDKDGSYNFHLLSDDGSKLWIDEKLVVDNDGIHAPVSKSGKAKLTKGMHKVVVAVFNAGSGFELTVEVDGPGLSRQLLGPLVYRDETGKAVSVPGTKEADLPPLQPELIAKGKELFTSMGCANCHQMDKEKKSSTALALAKLKPEGGCLDSAPKKGIPWYSLSAAQKSALSKAIQTPPPAKLDEKETVVRTMTTFNCYACHERGKIGGVEDELNKYFQTSQPEMGDEARIPPSLNGVGAKLNAAYMKKLFDQGAHDRPYMYTRMPKFGSANVGHLVALYGDLDGSETAPKVTFAEALPKVKAAARHMVGPKALGCIKCHTFAGNKAEGVQGIDMALMTERLKKDWFHYYMINPNKYRPGTRMPSSFPDGESLQSKVLDGKAATQIEAIWVYLADGKAALPPLGMNKSSIPLIPSTEAIIYRNFIQGAGPRAIGVGYPERVHLAFDANEVRMAMLWQGAFMDAKRHWTDRGVGFEPPLGENILNLPAGATFAVLSQPDEPWPTLSPKQQGYKFHGYRLADDQRPTFLYSYKDVTIEDFPNAVETKGNPAIRRTFTLTAEKGQEKLYLRAAVADKIEVVGDGWYRINDWRMRIESAAAPEIRRVGNKMELIVPVRFEKNSAKIVQEFAW